jgi:hypothetical protein
LSYVVLEAVGNNVSKVFSTISYGLEP